MSEIHGSCAYVMNKHVEVEFDGRSIAFVNAAYDCLALGGGRST